MTTTATGTFASTPTLHMPIIYLDSSLLSEVWKMSDDFWSTKIRITCEEKHGKCSHEIGDSFVYSHPVDYSKELYSGIQEPARPRVSFRAAGIPSWEADGSSIY